MAKRGDVSYRLRYKPSPAANARRALYLNGYGVELALKRTDYIVIDDRQAAIREETDSAKQGEKKAGLAEDVPADLQPLSKSELLDLGVNAASFVMNSQDSFGTLLTLLGNFPMHSPAIASYNATPEFMAEFRSNRNQFLPAGYNIMWINGLQIDPREVNAFSLLEILRRERKLIKGFKALGFTASESVDLLSHPIIAVSQDNDEPQRYNYRDDNEGGDVIVWLNDIEHDKRYEGWTTSLRGVSPSKDPFS